MMVGWWRVSAEPGYSLCEYTTPCRRLASYRRSAAGMRTKRCDGVATLGENRQVSMTKTKETLERESLLFGSGTWIRTKNNGVRGRYVTLTPFRHCLCARIFYHNGLRLSSGF